MNNIKFTKPITKLKKLNTGLATGTAATVVLAGILWYNSSVDSKVKEQTKPYQKEVASLTNELGQVKSDFTNYKITSESDLESRLNQEKTKLKNELNNASDVERAKYANKLSELEQQLEKEKASERAKYTNKLSELEQQLEKEKASKIDFSELRNYDANRAYLVNTKDDKITLSYANNGEENNIPEYKRFMRVIDKLYAAGVNKKYLDKFVTRHDKDYASEVFIEPLTKNNLRRFVSTMEDLNELNTKLDQEALSLVVFKHTKQNRATIIQYEILSSSKLKDIYTGVKK